MFLRESKCQLLGEAKPFGDSFGSDSKGCLAPFGEPSPYVSFSAKAGALCFALRGPLKGYLPKAQLT
jgi:hypothetical protein